MGVTRADVVKIAGLSQLQLTEDEIESYMRDLNAILGYVEQLNQLNVSSIHPMESVYFSPDRWRNDAPAEKGPEHATLSNGPEQDGPFFVVPKVIES